MQVRSRYCRLCWIGLVVVILTLGIAGPWAGNRPLAYGAEGTDEQETASSVSSQMAFEGSQSTIPLASQAFRQQVTSQMEQAALGFGLVLDMSDLLCLSLGDITVASAGVAGFEGPAGTAAVARTNVGLIYVSRAVEIRFGDGEHGTRPAGFYAVRLTYGQSNTAHDPGIALLELVAGPDEPVLAFPVQLRLPMAGRGLTACLGRDANSEDDRICLGWSGQRFTVEVCLFPRIPAQ